MIKRQGGCGSRLLMALLLPLLLCNSNSHFLNLSRLLIMTYYINIIHWNENPRKNLADSKNCSNFASAFCARALFRLEKGRCMRMQDV